MANLPTQNAVSVAIDEAGRKAQGSVQWFIENKAAKDGYPAITDAPAITHGNQLTFSISKLMLIDDVFVTLGSANLNQRSMSVDSEINIAATGEAMASELRRRVFELQSGGDIRGSGDRSDIPNLCDKWNARMKDNLVVSMKSIRRMKGFLLPFEDHRATSTMHASITVPSSTNTATV